MRIVLTGSSSGIGLRLRQQLALDGHEVWGFSRRPSPTSATSGGAASPARHTQGDVSQWPDVAAFRQRVGAEWPAVDALVCCAAVQGPIGPAMSADPVAWNAAVQINLTGTYNVIRAFFDLLGQSTLRPKIICFSGGGATAPRPNFSAYAASKTAVVRLVENLACEWTGQRIDINAVAPGAVDTQMTDQVLALGPEVAGPKEYQAALAQKKQPPEDKYPGLIRFLLSAAADGITGRLLSAVWDPWTELSGQGSSLENSDLYTLRRITPQDRPKR